MSSQNNIFVSHIHEEAKLGAVIKEWVEDAFTGSNLSAFLSSDSEDIPPGKKWLEVVEEQMARSKVVISIISPLAIKRPWINIELGAAWIRRLPVIPFYHSGLNADQLPRPFQDFNGISLHSPNAAENLIGGIADALGVGHPKKLSFEEFLKNMQTAVAPAPNNTPNIWGVRIVSPEEGKIIGRKLTVRGTISKSLPPGYSLRILRCNPNSGGIAPSGQVSLRDGEWEALEVDVGGNPGESRVIESWAVGPDGDALLQTWDRSAATHYKVNKELKAATGSYGDWLPYIHKTTTDMIRCARVTVIRRKNAP